MSLNSSHEGSIDSVIQDEFDILERMDKAQENEQKNALLREAVAKINHALNDDVELCVGDDYYSLHRAFKHPAEIGRIADCNTVDTPARESTASMLARESIHVKKLQRLLRELVWMQRI